MKQVLFSLLIITSITFSHAQSDFEPNGSFNVEVGLPNNVSNVAFRELLQGLVTITPSYQYTFNNSLSIGAGLRYNYFNINEFKNNIGLKGGLHILGAFAKIGQEKYYGNFGLDYGIRAGYAFNVFSTSSNKENHGGPHIDNSAFIEPVIGLALKSGDQSSFRLTIGYAFHTFDLRPEHLGTEYFSGIDPDKLGKITTYFSIGFGYSYYFGKK